MGPDDIKHGVAVILKRDQRLSITTRHACGRPWRLRTARHSRNVILPNVPILAACACPAAGDLAWPTRGWISVRSDPARNQWTSMWIPGTSSPVAEPRNQCCCASSYLGLRRAQTSLRPACSGLTALSPTPTAVKGFPTPWSWRPAITHAQLHPVRYSS